MQVSTRVCNKVVYSDELYHHGIKGQRWGIRRFQTLKGKLTSLGKKHVAEQNGGETGKTGTSGKSASGSSGKASSKPKKLSEMSDNEITNAINRMKLEKDYIDKYNTLHPAQPKKESPAAKILKESGQKLLKDATNALSDKASKWLEKKLTEALGLGDTEAAQIKKMKDYVDNQKVISEYKEAMRKAAGQETDNERIKREAEYAKNRNEKDNQDWQYEKRQDEKANYRAKHGSSSDNTSNSNRTKEDTKTYTGTVEGKGTSTYKESKGPIYDADYRDVSSSNSSGGSRFMSDYLALPAPSTPLLEDRRKK